MTTVFLSIIILPLLMPGDSLALPVACATLGVVDGDLVAAPFAGNTIYRLAGKESWRALTFTDDVSLRIVGFAATPFALFINDGTHIIRYFLSTLDSTVIARADDIIAFSITASEEIVYADKRTRTVRFLDYTEQEKKRLEDLLVRDIVTVDTLVYVLTNATAAVYDEFGARCAEYPHDGLRNGMHVQNDCLFLFTKGQHRLDVIMDGRLVTYDLPFALQDISGVDSLVYILDERGTALYRYHRADF